MCEQFIVTPSVMFDDCWYTDALESKMCVSRGDKKSGIPDDKLCMEEN